MNLCKRQMRSLEGVVWLLHSLEGPDQLVQVSGDVAQGELQRSDDVFEAKQKEHVQLMTLVHVCHHEALNSSHQMHKIVKMDKKKKQPNLKRHIKAKECGVRYTPACELFHGDPFLDGMLSTRVDQWQSGGHCWLVLGCHLVEEPTRAAQQISGQRSRLKRNSTQWFFGLSRTHFYSCAYPFSRLFLFIWQDPGAFIKLPDS